MRGVGSPFGGHNSESFLYCQLMEEAQEKKNIFLHRCVSPLRLLEVVPQLTDAPFIFPVSSLCFI